MIFFNDMLDTAAGLADVRTGNCTCVAVCFIVFNFKFNGKLHKCRFSSLM